MRGLLIEIPGTPSLGLSPNGRLHWRAKSKLASQAKGDAKSATLSVLRADDEGDALAMLTDATEIKVMIEIRWEPRRKRMDQDNAIACCKSYLDGIALAIERDDKVFRILGVRQERDPSGIGCVAVTLMPVFRDAA